MRDPNRLDNFYNTMKIIHKKTFPDWRFGQLMSNFLGWVFSEKKIDPFFPEEDKMLEYFKEFAGVDW
jgi:hypothetical protein